jgi:hypothetical protein
MGDEPQHHDKRIHLATDANLSGLTCGQRVDHQDPATVPGKVVFPRVAFYREIKGIPPAEPLQPCLACVARDAEAVKAHNARPMRRLVTRGTPKGRG